MRYTLQSQHLDTGVWSDVMTFAAYADACAAWRTAVRACAWHVRMVAMTACLMLLVGTAQAQVRMGVDGPAGEVGNTVTVCGWALDLLAHPRSGVDVDVEFYTNGGRRVVRVFDRHPRPDIAARYGMQDANVGFCASSAIVPGVLSVAVVTATSQITGEWVHRSVRYTGMVWPGVAGFPASIWSWTNSPKQGSIHYGTVPVYGVARNFNGAAIREVRLFTVNRANPHELPLFHGYAGHGLSHAQPFWSGYAYSATLTLPVGTYDLLVEAVAMDDQHETRITRIEVR